MVKKSETIFINNILNYLVSTADNALIDDSNTSIILTFVFVLVTTPEI